MGKIKRALISATDKNLIKDLAIGLNKLGVQIYSTRGTAAFLKTLGIDVLAVESYTGFPEILDGRVKTLHPKIFGGILAKRESADHMQQLKEHGVVPFDLVCVDLYPVVKVISEGASLDKVIENIDIGGITLMRASAKAFKDVVILTDSADFTTVLSEMQKTGDVSYQTRKYLAGKAFTNTSSYDKAIQDYFAGTNTVCSVCGDVDARVLRYGENPHQTAQYFEEGSYIKEVVRGEVSYNNILDLDGAIELCFGLKALGYKYAAVIVKHGSPSGVGVCGQSLINAFNRAWDCDTVSSYGGALVLSEAPSAEILEHMKGKFVEVICASSYSKDFIEKSVDRKKLKVLVLDESKILEKNKTLSRSACGGTLTQSRDAWWNDSPAEFKTVSKRQASKNELEAMRFAWSVSAITKSNAIIIAEPYKILGIGGGCVSRIDAANMAIDKAKIFSKCENGSGGSDRGVTGSTRALVLASDGFLPFADSVASAVELGITAIIEPGGSIRDEEVIAACDKANIALIFTGRRHFRH